MTPFETLIEEIKKAKSSRPSQLKRFVALFAAMDLEEARHAIHHFNVTLPKDIGHVVNQGLVQEPGFVEKLGAFHTAANDGYVGTRIVESNTVTQADVDQYLG